MAPKLRCRILVDIVMTLLLLFLMGYHIWGEQAHEWFGAAIFLLFLAHHILNRQWYKNLFRGKYTPVRILQVLVNILLLMTVAVQVYSGIILSRFVFDFLPIHGYFDLKQSGAADLYNCRTGWSEKCRTDGCIKK